jgi:alpha-beta hydrolase superfamily lysophospholipase
MKKKDVKILSLITAGIEVFMALGWPFFDMMVRCKKKKKESRRKWFQLSHTKVNHPRNGYEEEYETGKEWCRQQNMRDCYIKSAEGLKLHAYYLPVRNAERFVILSHGYKGSGFGDFAYTARFLHENGCNLLFIDQRCCGESEGEYITFGAREKDDVRRWTYYIDHRNKRRLPIYLYGESMGAAAVLMSTEGKLPKTVAGIIADCGFNSMKQQLKDMAYNWFHLGWIELLIFRVAVFSRVVAGFYMREADVTKALSKNRLPILYFHGGRDTYVAPGNSVKNYNLTKSEKELVIIPEARHLCCPYVNPELYRGKLLEFFEKYDWR